MRKYETSWYANWIRRQPERRGKVTSVAVRIRAYLLTKADARAGVERQEDEWIRCQVLV